jgi:hypothetical protein
MVEYLSSHPDICFSRVKEPHYFNTDFPNFRFAKNYKEYLNLFESCHCAKVVGDASVQYLYSKVAAQQIANFAPDAKILIMLRKPAAFIRSYHNQLLMNCDEAETCLRTAWQMSGIRPPERIPSTCREPQFLDYKCVGKFSDQVNRYFDYFPAQHIEIVFMEDWVKNPYPTYLRLMDFFVCLTTVRPTFKLYTQLNMFRVKCFIVFRNAARRPLKDHALGSQNTRPEAVASVPSYKAAERA